MADRVSIGNLALQKIGAEDTITDPDQDSNAARTVKAAWDDVRRECLRGGRKVPRWNFAERYAETAARSVTALNPLPYGWAGAYPRPDGALRLAEILYPCASSSGVWKYAGNEVLLKETGPLKAWWIFDIVDPAEWDALFVDTFAARLAYQVCDRITGDRGRKSDCWNEYQANLSAAAKVDAIENPPVQAEEDDWILARGDGVGFSGRINLAP